MPKSPEGPEEETLLSRFVGMQGCGRPRFQVAIKIPGRHRRPVRCAVQAGAAVLSFAQKKPWPLKLFQIHAMVLELPPAPASHSSGTSPGPSYQGTSVGDLLFGPCGRQSPGGASDRGETSGCVGACPSTENLPFAIASRRERILALRGGRGPHRSTYPSIDAPPFSITATGCSELSRDSSLPAAPRCRGTKGADPVEPSHLRDRGIGARFSEASSAPAAGRAWTPSIDVDENAGRSHRPFDAPARGKDRVGCATELSRICLPGLRRDPRARGGFCVSPAPV